MTASSLIALDSNARTLIALVLENLKTLLSETRVADRTGDHAGRACRTRCTCSTHRTGCACRGWAWRRAMRGGASRRLRSRIAPWRLASAEIAIAPHFRRSAQHEEAIIVEEMRRWTPNSIRRSSCRSKSACEPLEICASHSRLTRVATHRARARTHPGASRRRERSDHFVRACAARAPSPYTGAIRSGCWRPARRRVLRPVFVPWGAGESPRHEFVRKSRTRTLRWLCAAPQGGADVESVISSQALSVRPRSRLRSLQGHREDTRTPPTRVGGVRVSIAIAGRARARSPSGSTARA
jgi:hypothetical protein